MTTPRARRALDDIPVYKPGKAAASEDHKLSSNENPYDPLPGVMERAAVELGRINRYPDAGTTALYDALSAKFGPSPDVFAAGTGSVAVLYALLNAHLEAGDEVIYAWRSFEAYPIAADLTGATTVRVPLRPDATHDLDAMAAAVTDRTRVVLVCTPNNPTGAVVKAAELDRFLAWCLRRCSSWSTRRTSSSSAIPMRPTDWRRSRPTPTSSCSARSPRRTAWPVCGSATR